MTVNRVTWARKTSVKTTTLSASGEGEANHMDSLVEVLTELKSLRTEIGAKLDNIDTRLTDMVNSITTMESKVLGIKQDVSS